MSLRSPLHLTRNYFDAIWLQKLKHTARHQSTSAAIAIDDNWKRAKPFHAIPGPKPLPIPLGNIWKFTRFGPYGDMNFIEVQRKLAKEYGPIVRMTGVGRGNIVYLYDADYIEAMFRNDGVWPVIDIFESLPVYLGNRSYEMFKHGTIALDQGQKWRSNRSSVPQMVIPKQALMYAEPVDQVANMFISRVKSLRDVNAEMPKDFHNELSKWSLESMANFTLDTRLGLIEKNWDPESDGAKLITTSRIFIRHVNDLNFSFSPPIWKFISIPVWKDFVQKGDALFNICSKHIDSKVEEIKDKMKDKHYEPKSLLEVLYHEEKSTKLAALMAVGLLVGGTEPVAATVASAIYHLSKNSDKQEKLFQELIKFLPNKETPITSKTLNELKYLKACIKESMRISPPNFGVQRRATKDYVIDQYRIPKGTSVVAVNIVAANDEKHFQNSNKFMPERWLRSEKDHGFINKEAHPFASLPFGFGVRMCVGRRFAELGMEIIIAKIIRNFKVEYNHGDMIWKFKGVNRCAKPLQFRFEDRKN